MSCSLKTQWFLPTVSKERAYESTSIFGLTFLMCGMHSLDFFLRPDRRLASLQNT